MVFNDRCIGIRPAKVSSTPYDQNLTLPTLHDALRRPRDGGATDKYLQLLIVAIGWVMSTRWCARPAAGRLGPSFGRSGGSGTVRTIPLRKHTSHRKLLQDISTRICTAKDEGTMFYKGR